MTIAILALSGSGIPGTYPNIAICSVKRIRKDPTTNDGLQSFAMELRKPSGTLFLHQSNGSCNRVDMPHPIMKKSIWAIPPPTRNNRMKSDRNIVEACFVCMNPTDQMIIAIPTVIAAIPVIRKLGMMVKAGSYP